MVERSQLAVMDYNAGSQCKQAKTKDKANRFKLSFSKVTQTWVVKEIAEKKNKFYLEHLMRKAIEMKSENLDYAAPILPVEVPKHLSSKPKPEKDLAVMNKRTRFSM